MESGADVSEVEITDMELSEAAPREPREMGARIVPLAAPFEPDVEELLHAMMPPGVPPIGLFRMFGRNPAMTAAMQPWGRHLLGRTLSVDLRAREVVIDRTCARCGCEYEWGVHVAFFASRAGLTQAQVASLTTGGPDDPCWESARDRLLVRLVDELHEGSDVGRELWSALRAEFDEDQLMELLLLCGWYHAISFVARGARVPLEEGVPRFASFG
jgi:alkylhydroperoxidase family enzyme